MTKRIGIDVGGVITDRVNNDGTDTNFRGDNFMKTSAVKGAFVLIKDLIERYGAQNVFIVSKCGLVIEDKTRRWLDGHNFYQFTGFNPDNLYFCRERADKAPIVQRLGITDFIDDREEVLGYMKGIVKRRYLFGPQTVAPEDPELIIVATMQEVREHLL